MKKFLLIAALAAVALGANADGYKLEKVWEISDLSFLGDKNEVRQGIGMNGKFYINNKKQVVDTIDGVPTVTTAPVIYEVDENGLTGVTYPGGANCGITRDEAGNIIVSLAQFPNTWHAGIRVINPETGEFVEYDIPEECAVLGRCDFLGTAKGNLMEDGEIYITGGGNGTDVCRIVIAGGEVDFDASYYASCDGTGATVSNQTPLYYYADLAGDDAVLYVTRNAQLKKLTFDGDNFVGTTVTLPGKGACNGTFPFVWDGMELFAYPTLPNYQNGFAVAESGAESPLVEFASTVTANANGYQANWVNAEVDANGVNLYQYYPGGHLTLWRLTKDEPAPEPAKVYMLGGDDQGWDPTKGTEFTYDAENDVYTATITFPAENNYFGFTTALAENNDDGGWAYIEPFRFGAVSEGDYWYTGEEDFISLTWDEYHAIRIAGGEYNMTVDLNDMKLFIEKVQPDFIRGDVDGDTSVTISDVTALIDILLSGAEAPAAADCDGDTNVSISDVTALIDFLLSGNWGE